MAYFVYILKCADETFYTGVTTDMARRISEHNSSKKGAKYTSARRPVQLVYQEDQPDRSSAQRREYVLRKLPRAEKQRLSQTSE